MLKEKKFSDPALGDVEGNWDYRRTCVDGPVFNAAHLVW